MHHRLPELFTDVVLRLVGLALCLICLSSVGLAVYEAAMVAPRAAWWLIGALAASIGLVLVELVRATPDPHDHSNDHHDRHPH
jgi:hypothetical protein